MILWQMLVASQIYCVIWSMWYEIFPVSVLAAAELNQSVRESALLLVQKVLQRVLGIIHDR